MSISNENFDVGGTGGAIFAGPTGAAPVRGPPRGAQSSLGDSYRPPAGVPEWKQPSFDDDDRIDPRKYPEPSAGPASTFLSRFFPDPVQQGLALAKGFYFFFFGAFGSLFPLMAIYFKQLGMDAFQTGFLIGVRHLTEYLATPFWNKMSNRFQKGKIMLMVALASWIVFTLPIGYLRPPVVSCKYYNGSQYLLKLPNYDSSKRDKRDLSEQMADEPISFGFNDDEPAFLTPEDLDEMPRALPFISDFGHMRFKREAYDHNWAPGYVVGTSPQAIRFTANYNEKKHKAWVSPAFSNEVFEKEAVHKVFFLLLLLVIIGEFFSSPAIALADSAVITLLGEENQDKYGKQRVFGSLGWGLFMFIMGIALDNSRYTSSKCNVHDAQRNYHVCFSVFAALMFCALLVATQIPFKYAVVPTNNVPMSNMQQNGGPQQKRKQEEGEGLKKMAEKTKVFATQLRSMPEFNAVFRAMANLRLLTFMLVAWVMGIGAGLIFTFLFWHLQDYGGGPTLFGIASVINHLSEICAFFFTFKFINRYGHIKILAAGLLCNCLRFLYISFITWPWFVLPFEFVQGITHAAVWAACCSFITHNTDAELRPSAQGVLQGLHHGFGRFCGAVFGGMLIKSYGTVSVFRSYSILCLVFLAIFIAVNLAYKDEGMRESEDAPVENFGSAFAPHGVPSAPMPRALSSTKLEDEAAADQQQPQGPNLSVPGNAVNNPFLQQDVNYSATGSRIEGSSEQQYYGRGYSQAQSGYSSSGFGLQ